MGLSTGAPWPVYGDNSHCPVTHPPQQVNGEVGGGAWDTNRPLLAPGGLTLAHSGERMVSWVLGRKRPYQGRNKKVRCRDRLAQGRTRTFKCTE